MSYPPARYWDNGWPVVTGCTPVSAACVNCWARACHKRLSHNAATPMWHHPFGEVRMHPEVLKQPRHWRTPRRVFVAHMSDLWHETVPEAFRQRVIYHAFRAPQHTWLYLTKRPQFMHRTAVCSRDYAPGRMAYTRMWFGVTIEGQRELDERLPHIRALRRVWPGVIWVSLEPLLEAVDCTELATLVDWAVIGGESGRGARACDVSWVVGAATAFRAAGKRIFVKQLGALPVGLPHLERVSGGAWSDPEAWGGDIIRACGGPERLRQFPEVMA